MKGTIKELTDNISALIHLGFPKNIKRTGICLDDMDKNYKNELKKLTWEIIDEINNFEHISK